MPLTDEMIEARETAREIRECGIREGFMDDLEIPRGSACRKCAWMNVYILDEYIDLVDDDNIMPGDIYDLARRMCAECKAHTVAERNTALRAFFDKEAQQ